MGAEIEHVIDLPRRSVRFWASAATSRGRVREHNEDAHLVAPPVFVVADGMGGHAHGDRASAAAVAAFRDRFAPDRPAEVDDVLDAVRDANAAVRAIAVDGLVGTTLAGVALVTDSQDAVHWLAFNIGDSRVYRFHPRGLAQMTVDHSVVAELVAEGRLSEAEALTHPERNVVTRALGAADQVEPDIWLLRARPGDAFLLCSDGLSRELDPTRLEALALDHDGDEPLADTLVRAAEDAGGHDNITALVVSIGMTGAASDEHLGDTVDRLPRALEETNPRLR